MKKLLVLMLVLGLASLANATLVGTIDFSASGNTITVIALGNFAGWETHDFGLSFAGTATYDGTVVAYRVMAADSIDWPRVDQMTVVASKGWYLPLWNGARVVRRMVENGQVVILSPERQIARLKLELNSRPDANNLVQISVNGHLPLEAMLAATSYKTALAVSNCWMSIHSSAVCA